MDFISPLFPYPYLLLFSDSSTKPEIAVHQRQVQEAVAK
jgi:hypothetical protein